MIVSKRLDHTINVLQAVVCREIKSRYAGDAVGYFWVYATPLAWIAVIYSAFVLLGRRVPTDTDTISFILSGIIPYMAFRFGISGVIRARSSYRQVVETMGVDRNLVYLGVSVVEGYNILLLYAVLLAANMLAFGKLELDNLLAALSGMLLACVLGASFGYAVVAFSSKSEVLVRSVPVVLRPMFYISGVFYTANELPSFLAAALAWNPLFHVIEYMRTGLFLSYESEFAIVAYPLLLSMLFISVGMNRTRRFR